MKTNKLVARLRVQKLESYSETQKGYIISLLAEQAARVFEGLIKENEELFELSQTEENCEQGQVEFALVVSVQTNENRKFVEFLINSSALFIDKLKKEFK
jgi:hypothetical protein